MIYEPAEDSLLLKKHIKHYALGKNLVLDMGTGSGLLAVEAAGYVHKVIAVDINPEAIKHCRKTIKKSNIEFRQSDLFSNIQKDEIFDLIIFNPPYLPLDKDEPEDSQLATTGGKKGYELIQKFLSDAKAYLAEKGEILLLFSSLTGINDVNRIILKNGFTYNEVARQHLFFEDIIVYILK